MALLFTVISGIFSTVANATVIGNANLGFSMLTDHGKEECKRHDLALEKLQRVRDEWNKYRMKHLDSIDSLQNKQSLYHLSPNYQIFIIHHRAMKVVDYYLLQWIQALQHMPYTSTLNK